MNIIKNIKECFSEDGRLKTSKFNSIKTQNWYISIKNNYNWCNGITEILYCLENDIKKQPICVYCNVNPVKFKSKKYNKTCSCSCSSNKDKKLRSKTRKATNLKKYGVANVASLKSIKEKKKRTCLERYGVDVPAKSPIIMAKIKKTNMKRYGVENVAMVDSHHQKMIKTNTTRYGCNYPAQNKIIKAKMNKTLYENYGVTNAGFLSENDYSSVEEQTLFNYIKKIYKGKIIQNTRDVINPYEIDIYLPELKLAIEYNGLYWHSYNTQETKEQIEYHKMKTDLCIKNDIRLFHIDSYQWDNKKDIIKSMLNSNINKNNISIYARKCSVNVIDLKTASEFYTKNHLQGPTRSSYYIGLFFNNNLVSCMSFNKSKDSFDLTRYATLCNYSIVGGASKLLKYFVVNFSDNKEIFTFADLSYSYGDLYTKIGFKEVSKTKPGYYYTSGKDKIHRRNFQKKYIKKWIPEFDSNLTESENIFYFTNYRRYWDCGKIKFVYNNTSK